MRCPVYSQSQHLAETHMVPWDALDMHKHGGMDQTPTGSDMPYATLVFLEQTTRVILPRMNTTSIPN